MTGDEVKEARAVERALSEGLRALAASVQSWRPSPEMEQRVLGAWDQERSRGRERRRLMAVAATLGLAAAAVFAIVRVLPTEPARVVEPSASKAPDRTPAQSYPATDAGAGAVSVVPEVQSRRQSSGSSSEVAVRSGSVGTARPANREVVTFFPLGPADPDPAEPLQIMRVRLSRRSLAGFGVPIEEASVADDLQADVLVGEDGVARAIRFVPIE